MSSSFAIADDPALPQRGLLLSDTEVSRRLSIRSDGGKAPLELRRIRTKYRFGESFRALFRSSDPRQPTWVSLRTYPAKELHARWERARIRGKTEPDLAPSGFVRELSALYWVFPNDRKIRGLKSVVGASGILSRWLPELSDLRLVAYAPEKCATFACLSKSGRALAYAKCYADREHAGAATSALRFAQRISVPTSLQTPRILEADPAETVLLMEALGGQVVSRVRGPDGIQALRAMGRGVATLHGFDAPRGVSEFERLSPERIEVAARLIRRVRPDLRGQSSQLSQRLLQLRPAKGRVVALHGDLHPKNAILMDSGFGLIDFDQLARGPAACDLGSLAAAFVAARVTGRSFPGDRRALDAFLDGYTSVAESPDPHAIRWHTAAALFAERGLRAVTRLRSRSLRLFSELLDAADATLNGDGDV